MGGEESSANECEVADSTRAKPSNEGFTFSEKSIGSNEKESAG
jgi:hypothetical protein